MYDEIRIQNLEIFANHGVFPEETALGQKFVLSATLHTDTRRAGKTDALEHSIHYGEAAAFLTEFTKAHPRKLIEAAAEDMAEALLLRYPQLRGVTLELKKPWAPVGLPLETVSVKIARFWHRAYIALGSNTGSYTHLHGGRPLLPHRSRLLRQVRREIRRPAPGAARR